MPVADIVSKNALAQQSNGVWASGAPQPFNYSDGDQSESYLFETLSRAHDLSVHSAELEDAIQDWPSEYHLSYRRSHLFSCFDFASGAQALELGSGCGAVTRSLAERGLNVDAIEGSSARAGLAAKRCDGLENVRVINANYNDLLLPQAHYDFVFFIGVLEYAKRFRQESANPREAVSQILQDVKQALKPNGVIIIAIENRLGLKYQLGAGEDHHYKPYMGLFNYPNYLGYLGTQTDQTYSKSEWSELLAAGGFEDREFLYPFPDYKIPSLILSNEFLARHENAATALMGVDSIDHTGHLANIPHEYLYWKSLHAERQLGAFANSFLICASPEQSAAQSCLSSDFAYVSPPSRARGYRTLTRMRKNAPTVEKIRINVADQSETVQKFKHTPADSFAYVDGTRLDENWLAALQLDASGESFEEQVAQYYAFVCERLHNNADDAKASLDLLPKNIIVYKNDWHVIDQEWRSDEAVTPDFLLFRALLTFATEYFEHLSGYCRDRNLDSIKAFLSHLLSQTGTARNAELSRYLELESRFQKQATAPDYVRPLDVFLTQRFDGGNTAIRVLCAEKNTNKRLFEDVVKADRGERWQTIEIDTIVPDTAGSLHVYPGVLHQWFSISKVEAFAIDQNSKEKQLLEFSSPAELIERAFWFDVSWERLHEHFPFYAKTPHAHLVLKLPEHWADHKAESCKLCLRFDIAWASGSSASLLTEDLHAHLRRFNQRQQDYLTQNEFLRDVLGGQLESASKRAEEAEKKLKDTRTELNIIKSSKVWRLAEKCRELFYKKALGSVPGLQSKLLSQSRKQAASSLEISAASKTPNEVSGDNIDKTSELPPQLEVLTTDKATPETPEDVYRRRVQASEITEARHLEMSSAIVAFKVKPKISIVMPVYNVAGRWLERAIGTVRAQVYKNWELCIVDDCSGNASTLAALKRIRHPQIKLRSFEHNKNISAATNSAIDMSDGDYVAFMDHDDELAGDALFEIVKSINEHDPDFIYTDEDFLNADGERVQPHYKPDFSPDLLLSHNYITHFVVVKKSLLEKTGTLQSRLDGAQDYDFVLRATELAERIVHVPKVLYHWRMLEQSTSQSAEAKPEAIERARLAVQDAMQRRGVSAQVQTANMPHFFRVKRELASEPMVSIVLPFANNGNELTQTLHHLIKQNTYQRFEIIAVSMQPELPATEAVLEDMKLLDERVRIVRTLADYTLAAALNRGADMASGEHVAFLDLNCEIISWDWIQNLLEHSQRSEIAVAGGKTFLRDGRTHQAGLVIAKDGHIALAHARVKPQKPGYFNRANLIQNVSALPFGFFMCSKQVFETLEGFDSESFGHDLFDVDFCLRALEKGYYNLMTPYAQAYRSDESPEYLAHQDSPTEAGANAKQNLLTKHASRLSKPDPFYSAGLSQTGAAYGLRD